MKLFYAAGTCSLSPHIVAREAGIDIDLEQVDIAKMPRRTGVRAWMMRLSIPTTTSRRWNWTTWLDPDRRRRHRAVSRLI